MLSLERPVSTVAGLEFKDIPFGKGAAYAGFAGLSLALLRTVNTLLLDKTTGKSRIPPIVTATAIVLAAKKVAPVRDVLGPTGSDLLAITMMAEGLQEQFQLSSRVDKVVSGGLQKVGLGAPMLNAPMLPMLPEYEVPPMSVGELAAPEAEVALAGAGTREIEARLQPIILPAG